MASGGSYRIQSTATNKEFPLPPQSEWSEQAIGVGLNGIPINNSYRVHTWNFPTLDGCDYKDLIILWESQQDANSQLTELETDPYPSNGLILAYGTVTYDDFFITSVTASRGSDVYENVTVTFQVYVA